MARALSAELGLPARDAFRCADRVLAALADNDRHTRILRIQAGHEAKRSADAANWYAGTRPYGWRSVGHGQLEPVPVEQEMIDWMLRQREQGYGWENITRRLNEAVPAMPAPMGGRWHMSTVRRIVNRGRGWAPPSTLADHLNEGVRARGL